MIICPDRRQGQVIFRYIEAIFALLSPFADLVERKTQEAIYLTNNIVIEIKTASFKSTRGFTTVVCLVDEIAFLPQDASANPDSEILAALRPTMATVSMAMLICISSPYAKKGELWRTYEKYFGKNSDEVLVIQAASRTLNPGLPESLVKGKVAF